MLTFLQREKVDFMDYFFEDPIISEEMNLDLEDQNFLKITEVDLTSLENCYKCLEIDILIE